jgi:hypothetical protein
MQHQHVHRVAQPGNGTAGQGGLRLGLVSICWRVNQGLRLPKPCGT